MNSEIKAKWIEALRSGKYQQGQDVLKNTSSERACFCCLGVLCDISNLGAWDESAYVINEDWQDSFLPADVRVWAGLQTHLDKNKNVLDGTPEHILTVMNDSGALFPDIADWIEANL